MNVGVSHRAGMLLVNPFTLHNISHIEVFIECIGQEVWWEINEQVKIALVMMACVDSIVS